MWNATRLSESTQRSQSAKLTKDFERFQEPIGRSCQAKASNSEGRPGNSDNPRAAPRNPLCPTFLQVHVTCVCLTNPSSGV